MTSMMISRRAALGGMTLAAVAMPLPASAAPAAPSEFQLLSQTLKRRQAAGNAFVEQVLDPAKHEYERRAADVPHVAVEYYRDGGKRHILSTARPGDVRIAKSFLKGCTKYTRRGPDRGGVVRACRRLIAADYARQRNFRAIKSSLDLSAIEARSEHLDDLTYQSGWAAIECPVYTPADLSAKIDLIVIDDRWECADAQAAIIADVRRLAGVA